MRPDDPEGEPEPDDRHDDGHDRDELDGPLGDRTDPKTGSTKPDPAAGESGLPPAGDDPMSGPAPSG
jgi:hypothetical protein